MSELSEKMRKAREKIVEVGKHKFNVLRPTDLDMMRFSKTNDVPRLIASIVVGWDNVTGLDLCPSGDANSVPFDAEACAEWLTDRADLLGPVFDDAMERYKQHKADLGESAKN